MQKPDLSAIWLRNRRLPKNCEQKLGRAESFLDLAEDLETAPNFSRRTGSRRGRGRREVGTDLLHTGDFLVLEDQSALVGCEPAARECSLVLETAWCGACFC
jgi:hypothetical protein